jgi:hypothetical protein
MLARLSLFRIMEFMTTRANLKGCIAAERAWNTAAKSPLSSPARAASKYAHR